MDVPQTGDYNVSIFDGSNSAASDVSGPTNIFVRVDGGTPQQVWLPVGYNWVIWNHADTTVHLTAGKHQISLSTTGADGAATNGDAIINKIDLQLDNPAVQDPVGYEAEQAALAGASLDYRAQGQSGAGTADIGLNTIRFIANPQYNYDSTTIGVIYSGSGVGQPLRSETAPNIDQITLARSSRIPQPAGSRVTSAV